MVFLYLPFDTDLGNPLLLVVAHPATNARANPRQGSANANDGGSGGAKADERQKHGGSGNNGNSCKAANGNALQDVSGLVARLSNLLFSHYLTPLGLS
jgi:hypothetical protein